MDKNNIDLVEFAREDLVEYQEYVDYQVSIIDKRHNYLSESTRLRNIILFLAKRIGELEAKRERE